LRHRPDLQPRRRGPAPFGQPAFKTAAARIDKEHGRIVEEGIKLAEIPSPPLREAARVKAYEKMFKEPVLPM
jgi:tripeptide aminopeptidase